MVNRSATPETAPCFTLDAAFSALSDPTRRAIVARLAKSSATAGELAAPFDMSLPAISKHLRVLEGAGLLARQVEGRTHRMTLRPETLKAANDWLAFHLKFWEMRLDALGRFLEETKHEEADHKRPNTKKQNTRSNYGND
jgi:DNA-binding transcriptional ArsR family regulator